MKLSKIMLAVAALGFVGIANAADNESSGTVTFTGQIDKAPCYISPETHNQIVPMGSIGDKLIADGKRSIPKPFKITLLKCDLSDLVNKTVTSTFIGDTSTGSNNKLFLLTGSASGASLGIRSGDQDIESGVATAPSKILFENQSNDLNFTAFLQGDAGATIKPGHFTVVTRFLLTYQ